MSLRPQNPWETGELSGLLSVAKDEGEVVNTWTVGVGFDFELVPVLRGRVDPHRYRRTIHQLNQITRKENVYNYTFALLMFLFVVLPIAYFFFCADITRGPQGTEAIILHDKLLMAITYVIVACDLPALVYVAYLGYRKEQNDIHSLTHLLLTVIALGNTVLYPFALEFIHAEHITELFLLYPLGFPFLAIISIFINRRLPELLGEAKEFVEKENRDYYEGKGVTLSLRPEIGDRLRLCVNLSSSSSAPPSQQQQQQPPPHRQPAAAAAAHENDKHRGSGGGQRNYNTMDNSDRPAVRGYEGREEERGRGSGGGNSGRRQQQQQQGPQYYGGGDEVEGEGNYYPPQPPRKERKASSRRDRYDYDESDQV